MRMKKSTKFVGVLLALLLTISSISILSSITVSAKNTDTKIYFEVPTEFWGAVKWNTKKTLPAVYCHLYYIYGAKTEEEKAEVKELFTAAGAARFTFGTANERCEWEHDNVYSYDTRKLDMNFNATLYKPEAKRDESGNYIPLTSADWEPILSEFTSPLKEGWDYGIIFYSDNTANVRHQTCDMTMSTDCVGKTINVPEDKTRMNTMDSEKQDYYAAWTDPAIAEDYGPRSLIDSIGNLSDGKFPHNQPKALMIADKLYDPAFKMKVNAKYFTTERLNELEAELGVTAREVYDQYVEKYKDLIEEGLASGELVDKYDDEGNPVFLVPTLERVAERLGIAIIVKGDVDGDGVVAINDATLIQFYLAGLEDLDENQLEAADCDNDGEVSILDVTKIQKVLAGLDTM